MSTHTVQQVLDALADPDPAARPMMRWWWFGPDLDRGEIDRELAAMAAAGLGGAEVALVYPLREGAPEYLSGEVLGHLRHAAERARELGLRLDVTLGSGWSYGGAHIGDEHAARRLHWERRDMGPEPLELELRPSWPGDELVTVHLGEGLPPSGWQRLHLEDGRLRIPAGRGPRTVLIAWSRTTGQQVKRAAAGAEGPVVDHLDADAVRHHLDVVGGAVLEAVPAALLGSVFSDSLEVYRAGWTPRLPERFAALHSYELRDVLHLLEVDAPGAEQVREDYGRTLSVLVEEGFVATCRQWAEEHGVRFRLQGYGEPPITLAAQRGAHLIEGEGAGWTALTQSRWASSAAHHDRRDVVSSEVWTWVHSPSFRATPLDLLAEAHEHLLLGITHFVGHGWPYTAPDVEGLGWTFYAAGALDDRNAWWPAMPELTARLARLCAALRLGEPGADVALYLPYADVRAAQGGGHDLWRACRAHVGEALPAAIRRAGYDLDLVDDDILETLDPAAYPLVVLPRVTRLPAAAAAWLDRVRAAGGTVLAVESPAYPAGIAVSMPETLVDAGRLVDHATLSMAGALPTAHDGDATSAAGRAAGPAASDGGGANPLAAALDAVALPPMLLEGDRGQVGVVCRRLVDGELFLLGNTGPTPLELSLAPRRPRAGLSVHDPATGARQALDPVGGSLALAPYESRLLLAHDEALADLHDAAPPRTVARPLDGPWSVAREGEEPRPVTLPHLLVGTEAADLRPLVLETTVTLDEREAAGPLLLDLGEGTPHEELGAGSGYRALLDAPVREVAIVEIDGHGAGMLWSPPYRLDLTGRISAGTSRLTLRVLGTTAPAAAAPENAMPAARDVAVAHATYGERFQPQELDLLLDGVATGLAAVPVLHLPAR
ncbi:glycosyl hydrolase [Brachybacterium sp. EE-P12]|uniref:glycosyl hydrolase n=1 Tax=Brachybacterium sp. EE-P12 TaxID=2306299 RepID=UPI000F078D73|nr:glycosyl hydrolase [Brachybacterium sp. EE-P12]